MGVQGLRVEIVSDGPPPEEEPECVFTPGPCFCTRLTETLELHRTFTPVHPEPHTDR